jgi:hypothetical protein
MQKGFTMGGENGNFWLIGSKFGRGLTKNWPNDANF